MRQLAKVQSATAATITALNNERDEGNQAFSDAKGPALADLEAHVKEEMDALDIAFDAKTENATEVHTYLTNNFTRYLTELLSHILTDAANEDDRDFIVATAI